MIKFNRVSIGCTAVLLAVTFALPGSVEAKKKRSRGSYTSGGGGGGGVHLSTPSPRNPLEHNNRGVELGGKGLWADAIREHEIALNGDPENTMFRQNLSSAHLHYADLLANKRKWYEAILHYREALYADPNNMPADHHLDECIKQMNKNPDDYKVREKMADEAEINGNYPIAIVEFRKCVKMADHGMSRYRLGRVLYKQGKIVESFEELRTAINKEWLKEERNELSNCHALMGEILWDVTLKAKQSGRGEIYMKRLNNVAVCYKRAATINPNNTDAIRGLITSAKEAVAIKDSFENNMMLAGGYVLAGDFERARMLYEHCYAIDPQNPVLHKARQSFHMFVVTSPMASPNIIQSSVLKIEKELEKRPDDAELLYIYGRGKEDLKDNDLALRAYKRAYGINPYINPDLAMGISRLTGVNPDGAAPQGAQGMGAPGMGAPGTGAPGTGGMSAAQGTMGGGPAPSGPGMAQAPPGGGPPQGQPIAKVPTPRINPAVYDAINGKIGAGDMAGAEQDLTALVDREPAEAQAWYMLGNVQEQQGKMAQAKVAYRQAKSLGAQGAEDALRQIDSSRINQIMGQVTGFVQANDFVKAAASLRQAIILAPDLPAPHRKLQEVLAKLGDKEGSEKEGKKADELERK